MHSKLKSILYSIFLPLLTFAQELPSWVKNSDPTSYVLVKNCIDVEIGYVKHKGETKQVMVVVEVE